MGEFVFPETIKRIGKWDEEGGGKGKKKEHVSENTMKMPEKTNDKMTIFEKLSHNNLSLELSISQVIVSYFIVESERRKYCVTAIQKFSGEQ